MARVTWCQVLFVIVTTGKTMRDVAERWVDGPARRLDQLLEAAEVKNIDLARQLDLDPSTISKYRSGERVPRADELAAMIERAGGSADEVLGLRAASVDPVVLRHAVDAAQQLLEAAPQLRRVREDKR
jgi:transcriptional regulator with XRE-family HTH domain